MKTISYEAVVKAACGAEMTEAALAAHSMAMTLDRLRATIAEDSLAMAERFTRYAHDTGNDTYLSDPPTGYSTLKVLTANAAAFKATLDCFRECFGALTGKRFSAVMDELRAASGEGSVAS